MPGRVQELDGDPSGPAARRAWRRNGGWRVWEPPSASATAGTQAHPMPAAGKVTQPTCRTR